MQLTVRVFGLEFLHVDLSDPVEVEGETYRESPNTHVIDAGKTDLYLGFTNGREDDGE